MNKALNSSRVVEIFSGISTITFPFYYSLVFYFILIWLALKLYIGQSSLLQISDIKIFSI